ncbi:hypothetical protein Tco_1433888 [Tanacetum coccineum]
MLNLTNFYPRDATIKYPSLVKVVIWDCDKMEKWGYGTHDTPNLQLVNDTIANGSTIDETLTKATERLVFMELVRRSRSAYVQARGAQDYSLLRTGINVIEAKIISGGNTGRICAILHMVITPDTQMPFKLNIRQRPVQVCFGMKIKKIRGQTLSYGKLYVVVSRFKSKKGLKFLYLDKDDNYSNSTTFGVYKEVLCHI